jgi:hypothetical protein
VVGLLYISAKEGAGPMKRLRRNHSAAFKARVIGDRLSMQLPRSPACCLPCCPPCASPDQYAPTNIRRFAMTQSSAPLRFADAEPFP